MRAGRRGPAGTGRRGPDLGGVIRTATPDDVPALHAMIGELADYERSPHEARATRGQVSDALFGEHPAAFALVAEEEGGGGPAGFALWFRNFSTWTGTHGVYLEDLFVRPHARGRGHGTALLAALARICAERGWERFEWSVLDWNEPSIGFYRSLGAEARDGWTVFRLSGEPLRALAAAAPPAADPLDDGAALPG